MLTGRGFERGRGLLLPANKQHNNNKLTSRTNIGASLSFCALKNRTNLKPRYSQRLLYSREPLKVNAPLHLHAVNSKFAQQIRFIGCWNCVRSFARQRQIQLAKLPLMLIALAHSDSLIAIRYVAARAASPPRRNEGLKSRLRSRLSTLMTPYFWIWNFRLEFLVITNNSWI